MIQSHIPEFGNMQDSHFSSTNLKELVVNATSSTHLSNSAQINNGHIHSSSNSVTDFCSLSGPIWTA
jgi:hypothetical protein